MEFFQTSCGTHAEFFRNSCGTFIILSEFILLLSTFVREAEGSEILFNSSRNSKNNSSRNSNYDSSRNSDQNSTHKSSQLCLIWLLYQVWTTFFCEPIEDNMFYIYLFSSPSLKCRVGLLCLKTNSFLYALPYHSVQCTIRLKSLFVFFLWTSLEQKPKVLQLFFLKNNKYLHISRAQSR